jgi:hypothetical protein
MPVIFKTSNDISLVTKIESPAYDLIDIVRLEGLLYEIAYFVSEAIWLHYEFIVNVDD